MNKQEAQARIEAAERELAAAKEALKEVEELKPWVAAGYSWRRCKATPGVYEVDYGYYTCSFPGHSRSETQAERRSDLDRANDLLWGLKMALEPDWEPDWNDPQQDKNVVYYEHNNNMWSYNRDFRFEALGAVYFSSNNTHKVVDYLNKHHKNGKI